MNAIEEQYKFMYKIEGTTQMVVFNELTGQVCLRKQLRFYDLAVFEYLKQHRNVHVATVFDYYEDDAGMLIVFEEYIQGITLEKMLRTGKPEDKRARQIFDDICEGVEFLHAAKPPIVHRDLKISNIMLTNDGVVKLVDYDASKPIERGKGRDTVLIGTEGYAAPEQYGFGSSDERTDVYALGAIAEALFSDKYRRAIKKARQIDPANRYENVSRFRRAINNGIVPTQKVFPPPGFRTGKAWKACTAVAMDMLWVWITITGFGDRKYMIKPVEVLYWICFYLIAVDICTDWTGFFMNLPGINSPNRAVRIFSKAVLCFIMYFMVFIIFYGLGLPLLWLSES